MEKYMDIDFKPYEKKQGRPYCQIYDLDGTLAIRGNREPFDWDRVDEDKVNESMNHLLWMNFKSGIYDETIIFSGRSDICREKTNKWIDDHTILSCFDDKLFMRKHNDMRDDVIIKYEMFNEHVRDKYNVRFVVDDRPKVCRMWRQIGLPVFQVGDPYHEF